MPVNFSNEPEKTEEDKIMNKDIPPAVEEKKAVVITNDTVFKYNNLETGVVSFYPWSQFRHMLTPKETKVFMTDINAKVTKQDKYELTLA